MASNSPFRSAVVALTTTTTTNILNPPTLTGGVNAAAGSTNTYLIIRHIRVVNKTNAAASLALWLGATGANAAGTEFAFGGAASAGALTAGTGVSVPANSYVDWYGSVVLNTTDFLVGGAGTATALTITCEGEIGVVS